MKTLLVSCFFIALVLAGTPDEWKSRTIYQLLTDRFATSDGSNQGCGDISKYCGGTFQGVIQQLDYISSMGFDAIWISPIPINYEGGYHGYWQTDFTGINSNFGSSADLTALVQAAHSKGIWVMLDVVGNHVGPVGFDYSSINPFNQAEHYHPCGLCPSDCNIDNWNNETQIEFCRLAGLPDLRQENSFVANYLSNWVSKTISTYGFDGLRIDTVPEVGKDFWAQYTDAAGVYNVGEVYNGDVNLVSSYQKPKGPLSAVLSYPLFFTMRSVFASQQSMYQLGSMWRSYNSTMGDVDALGTFIDNHDHERFLHDQSDYTLYKAGLIYTLYSSGIPIVYYGTEQGFSGGNDPNNREVLWPTNYDTSSTLYLFLQQIVNFRKKMQIWSYQQIERYQDDNFYAFTRGDIFVALTNAGSNGGVVSNTITYHPYSEGTKICNLFWPKNDCLTVKNKQFTVVLNQGESKIYYPV